MKIAIEFGDNDFHSTWLGVLKAFNESYKYNLGSHKEIDISDKKWLVKVFNKLSAGFYLLRQRGTEWENMENYLSIDVDNIFINEEVDELTQKNNNHEVFILNTDLDYENNECVYSN